MPNPLQAYRMRRYGQAIAASVELEAARQEAAVAPMQVGIESPFPHTASLNAVAWADLLGEEFRPLTRAAAMAIPALARQRHLLCGAGARCPLVVMSADVPVAQAPSHWTTRTDGQLSPYHRMLWTLDDLVFTGWSLWWVERGSERQVLTAERVALDAWEADPDGRIMVNGDYPSADRLVLIPGPHEGILNFGAPALRRMIDNLDAAATAARNPSAYLELHWTGDTPLTDPQIQEAREQWAEARRGQYGGVAFTGKYLEVKEHGTHESHLLIEGRNADAVDASRLVSSPAAMADATAAGASLTYETTSGRNIQFLDYGASLYLDAVAARLSMDDVVPRGQRTAFDLSQLTAVQPSPTGAPTSD